MTNEAEVRKSCRDAAKKMGWTVIPIPNARRADSVGGQLKGASDDVMLANGGRVVFVEYKAPQGGRVSEYQKAFGELLARLGHKYVIAKSVDELISTLEAA